MSKQITLWSPLFSDPYTSWPPPVEKIGPTYSSGARTVRANCMALVSSFSDR
jgi:hypothetical protein